LELKSILDQKEKKEFENFLRMLSRAYTMMRDDYDKISRYLYRFVDEETQQVEEFWLSEENQMKILRRLVKMVHKLREKIDAFDDQLQVKEEQEEGEL